MQSMTLAELDRQATSIAWHLKNIGLNPGDHIGILTKNSIEWVLLDLASIKLGTIISGFEVGRYDPIHVVQRYDLKLLLCDQPDLKIPKIISPETVRKWAENVDDKKIKDIDIYDEYQLSDVVAIKFTSGSTGEPKGLGASVGSINDSIMAVQEMFQHRDTDNILIFLPLSLLQQRYWVYSALVYGHNVTIATLDSIFFIVHAVMPTVIMGVPAFFDSVKRQLEILSKNSNQSLVERCNAIQSLLGGHIRYLWTGSAPCNRATLDYFNDAGIPLFEGYGMNETCIVSKNYPGAHRIGSVGKVLPNKTVRFDDKGILIVGSRNPVNTRYSWSLPEDNERMFLQTGEVFTGDLGYLDEDNYLYIIGRSDDVIALNNGRKVHVSAIEERFKSYADIHECVIYGAGKPFLTALISPADNTVDKELIHNYVKMVNDMLPEENRIKGLVVAQEKFSIENNLLTSQFKPKRKEIYAYFLANIEEIYGK